ncbi:MAG: 4-hydroxy-3-methylbut-2-enyl diphosphate reductase [Bacteroidales bacterium]|nr:4-hydroxy-3-methylbut-2-enyl diphosphate reductase [Bacteroidales bacterium]
MALSCSICEIDPDSGFCHGVVRAVNKAEEFLAGSGRLYSLGAMVHNTAEIARLAGKGLQTIDLEQMRCLEAGDTVLIRAHGEPPSTYSLARERGIRLIDCTCPVVLKLQRDIASAYRTTAASGGTVVIFGKKGHAEVNGLVGQTDGHAIVIENLDEIDTLDFGHHIELFSQTTSDPAEYEALKAACLARTSDITIHDTICRQVVGRHRKLAAFAEGHDVVLFVSGRESSNGKVLFELCRQHNPRTYWVDSPENLDDILDYLVPENVGNEQVSRSDGNSCRAGEDSPLRIGITGATSTPLWQLEQVAEWVSLKGLPRTEE